MFVFPISILWICISSSLSLSQVVQIEYVSFFGTYIIPLKIGTDRHILFESINQEMTFTWTSSLIGWDKLNKNNNNNNNTNTNKSDLIINSDYSTIVEGNEYLATEYAGELFLNDNTSIYPFHVLIFTYVKGTTYIESGFAFAKTIIDPKYSITHILYSQSMISKLSYALIPISRDHGNVSFGGIPDDIEQKYKSSKCKANDDYETWGCDLSHIFIGNISYVYENIYYINDYSNYHTLVQASTEKVLAPEPFMDFLKEHLFKEKIKNDYCQYLVEHDLKYFSCECSKIEDGLEDIYLIFKGGMSIKLHPQQLFKQFHQTCEFVFVSDSRARSNEWVFGSTFLSLFPILFDYDDKTLTFYSLNEDTFETIDLDRIFPMNRIKRLSWILVLIVIMVIVGIFVYRRFKLRKKTKMKRLIETTSKAIDNLK